MTATATPDTRSSWKDSPALGPLRRLLPGSRRPAHRDPAPLAAPVSAAALQAEVDALPPERTLATTGPLSVLIATPQEVPSVVREIGRLRERTFRAVGEGTGRSLDLDRFDAHYLHLFVFDVVSSEVVGAYRMAGTDRILRDSGQAGLYSTTCFRFEDEFFLRLGPALELGRSFVIPERQRSFAPLMLLWKGIGGFIRRNPQYRRLIGTVSISAAYGPQARALLHEWLRTQAAWPAFADLVRPVHPARFPREARREAGRRAREIHDLKALSGQVESIQPGLAGVPILVRQYMDLGGRFASFGVDPDFGNVLDGLVVIDLLRTRRRTLRRYLGRDGTERFLRHQRSPCPLDGPLDETSRSR